ncbi:MAG: exosortase O [Kastovskya adunca ATA6-11-RM4]|jgi:exosortase O|nr:exosortase O [Kastovskya adunca ATA6-11-RM4]
MRAATHSATLKNSILSSFLLLAVWAGVNISSLQWLFQSLQSASRLNLMLMGLGGIALMVQGVRLYRRGKWRQIFSLAPIFAPYPLLLMLGSAVSAIAIQWLVDIHQLTVLLFLLGTYGLCGVFLTPEPWRKGLPIATLLACVIPFSTQIGTGLGLPARILTAHAVEQILASWKIAAISSYDIIVLENGVAHVDAPCSGLKSLWIGTLFLLAVTGLEGRVLGWRWLLVCLSNLLLLISANTVRVLLLVLLIHVWGQSAIAEVLHVPLGILGLGFACAVTWLLLQRVPLWASRKTGESVETKAFPSQGKGAIANRYQLALLLVGMITIGLVPQLYPTPSEQPLVVTALQWPQEIVSKPIPLTTAEQNFFASYPSLIPEKRRFALGDLTGSMLVVANTSWRNYHSPELCLMGSGLEVNRINRQQLTPVVLARWLSLSNQRFSAAYWFQSPQQTTDDFLSRLWSEIARHQKNWVLVSILFDNHRRPDSPEIQAFATAIHDAIDRSLNVVHEQPATIQSTISKEV